MKEEEGKYKSVPYKINNENRFVIINIETGEVADDAQGWGYKSKEKSDKALWWKYKKGKEKTDNTKSEALLFFKSNPKLRKFINDFYEWNFKEFARGETTDKDLIEEVKGEFNIDLPKKYIKYA